MATLRRLKLEPGAEIIDPTQKFDLVQKLGEGSYGAVYKATEKSTGEIHAIKIVNIDSDFDGIMKEITILKSCTSPHIVSYHGSYRHGDDLWIVMEYCGGGSVSDCMYAVRHCLVEPQIAAICKQVLLGLSYLHDTGKIHRDIKCGNILLDRDGHAKLADFGVSAQLSATMSKRNTVIGTPFWMAPEVIQESYYDYKADIWSLGITAIEMAQGKPPYADVHPMRVIFMIPSRPPPKLDQPEEFSSELNDFIARCLVKSAEQRPTAKELLEHPFIAKAPGPAVMVEMIEEAMRITALKHASGGSKTNSTSSGTEFSTIETMGTGQTQSSTVRYSAMGQEDVQTLVASDTMLRHDGDTLIDSNTFVERPWADQGTTDYSGTTQRHTDAADFTPSFMQHFRSVKADDPGSPVVPSAKALPEQTQYDTMQPMPKKVEDRQQYDTIQAQPKKLPAAQPQFDTAVQAQPKPVNPAAADFDTIRGGSQQGPSDMDTMSMEQLRTALATLEADEAADIARIRETYKQRKQPILAALQASQP